MAHMIEQPGAAVSRLCKGRLHDFRHTFATHLAENGVSESTMFALMGHMSRSMLERYSHIRMAVKRDAMAVVRLHEQTAKPQNSEPVPVAEQSATIGQPLIA
jgi:site-specific recombinase XerD